jgi:hypothetical protein
MFPNLVEATSQRWIVMFIIADEMKFTNPPRLPVYQIPIRRRKPRLAFFGQPLAACVNTATLASSQLSLVMRRASLRLSDQGKFSSSPVSRCISSAALGYPAFDRRASETWPCLLACRVEALMMQKAVDIDARSSDRNALGL